MHCERERAENCSSQGHSVAGEACLLWAAHLEDTRIIPYTSRCRPAAASAKLPVRAATSGWHLSRSDRSPLTFGSSDGEAEQILTLALALLQRRRQPDADETSFITAVAEEEPPLALQLTERQKAILVGTTVEALPEQAKALLDAMVSVGEVVDDAAWALGVVLRRAQHVISPEDGRRWLHLPMLPELLPLRYHPDALQAPPLWQTSVKVDGQERNVLLRAAERDHRENEEIFLWSGRFSESELFLRGVSRSANESTLKNPTGIGGKVAIPENWNSNPRTPNYKEFRKFNCTSQEAFEVRLSKKGWPRKQWAHAQLCSLLSGGLASAEQLVQATGDQPNQSLGQVATAKEIQS